MTGIIIAVIVTLIVTKLYRLSPLCDTGSAIWHTLGKVHMDVTVNIFKRYVAHMNLDIGDQAVARILFPGSSDIVNRTLDANLAEKLQGVTSARALVKHNPLGVANQIANELFEQGFDVDVIDRIPHTTWGTMAFVVVKEQGWMYVIRRHAVVMLINQIRDKRRARRREEQTAV